MRLKRGFVCCSEGRCAGTQSEAVFTALLLGAVVVHQGSARYSAASKCQPYRIGLIIVYTRVSIIDMEGVEGV